MGPPLRVALLGCGVVGGVVDRLLVSSAPDLAARGGLPVELAGSAVRRPREADRGAGLDPSLFTTDAHELVTGEGIDIVVEVIGGLEPARSLILAAMERGAAVV